MEDTRFTTECESIIQHVCEEHYKVHVPKPVSVPVPIFTPVPAVVRAKRELQEIPTVDTLLHEVPAVNTLLLHILPAVPAVPIERDSKQLIIQSSPKTSSKRIIFEDSSVEVSVNSERRSEDVSDVRDKRQLSLDDPALLTRQVKTASLVPPPPSLSHQVNAI